MTILITISTILLFYVLPALYAWFLIKEQHNSFYGKYDRLNPDVNDYIMLFIPIFGVFTIIDYWLDYSLIYNRSREEVKKYKKRLKDVPIGFWCHELYRGGLEPLLWVKESSITFSGQKIIKTIILDDNSNNINISSYVSNDVNLKKHTRILVCHGFFKYDGNYTVSNNIVKNKPIKKLKV